MSLSKNNLHMFFLLIFIFFAAGCSKADDDHTTILVGAAASLTDAMMEIEPLFEEEYGINVDLQLSATGPLKQQIKSGAAIDVFLSASKKDMDEVVGSGHVVDEEIFLTNSLILARTVGSDIKGVEDLSGVRYIAIGEPSSVPAGKYAVEALGNLGLYDKLIGKFTYAKDVSQVLNWVELGNAEVGFIYYSDFVRSNGKVELAEKLSADLYTPIVYPMGLIKASVHEKEARVFMKFLKSEEAKRIFEKYGFSIPD